jgi:1-deoxy-D-xylulose-5-phosphate synthase
MIVLDKINYPEDIKILNKEELNTLCSEIRLFLIENISKTGGHLASNLGVVELTIALHKAFNMPKDKIIWDVGHQSYVHKMLTGRKELFHTLRKFDGLSGFPKPNESIYDIFATGHSSTSISVGLGIARARDIKKESFNVISVIGDGSLTGGVAFEAINDAGTSKTNMIVVLNDNEMSISQNVGSISAYLSKLRTNPNYINFRDDVEILVKKIPTIGDTLFKNTHKFKESLKYFFIQGILFEEFGFKYIGPIDGHNMEQLSDVLERAKKIKGPVLIHVLTKKGKGYAHAENNPDIYHSIGPFVIETGKRVDKSDINYSMVFGEEIVKEAATNEKIVAITAAMPDGTGLTNYAAKFKERFFDVGIAEQHAVVLAAGLASSGLKPVFVVYSTFLQRAYDQIIHDVCLQKLPVMFAIDRAGIVGEDGETHQGIFDISYLRSIPNLTILSPKDLKEFRMMLKWCFSYNGPVAIRYPRGGDFDLSFEVHDDISFGKWEIISKGSKIAILAVGKMTQVSKIVVDKLKNKGLNVTFVNSRFIKPMDNKMLDNIFETHEHIFTIEDNYINGGFGSGVMEYSSMKKYPGKISLIGFPNEFIPHGSCGLLYKKYNLDAEGILDYIYKTI